MPGAVVLTPADRAVDAVIAALARRGFEPCVSGATHLLDLTVDRR
jgi:hypothetical protein